MKNISIALIPSTSITPSFNSAPLDAGNLLYVSAQVVTSASSSPSFTAKLQASNDPCVSGQQANQFVPVNWSDVPNTTVTISADGALLIPKTEVCYRWVRVAVTFTSGTGNVIVNMFGTYI